MAASDVPGVAALAGRIVQAPATNPSAQPVAARFLPLIYTSAPGRAFRAFAPSRALATGVPAALCPALAAGGGATPAAAAQVALERCLGALRENVAAPDCGCRLLAVDAVALAPRDAFAYARGLSTRVFRSGRLDPLTHIAEETTQGDDRQTIVFAGARPAWRVRPLDPRTAEVTSLRRDGSADGPPRMAMRQILGLDRGRFIERIETPDLTLLIGF
ncbi:MAG: hypothetical protein AAGC92_08775 [Pseudomonadota bacterium]